MSYFILSEDVYADKFKECVDCLNNYKNRVLESYVEQDFPCFHLDSSVGIHKLDGGLRGTSWLDVVREYQQKEWVAEYDEDEGGKSFWLVLPSGSLQLVEQVSFKGDENHFQLIVYRPNESQLYLAMNFSSENSCAGRT